MIRGAIFDVDGTLLDSMHIWEELGTRYLRTLGREPVEDLAETFRTFTLEQSAAYFRSHYGVTRTVPEIVRDMEGLLRNFYFEEAQLRPGVEELLVRLEEAHIPMVLATATDRVLVEGALERCGILHHFSGVVTCAEAGSKTQPRIYEEARRRLGTPRADTWVFEDACHGAATAARAGFPVLGVRDPSEPDQEGLRALSAVYLENFRHPEAFWAEALK